jgi:DNA-binding MarR family transcriptional regulator
VEGDLLALRNRPRDGESTLAVWAECDRVAAQWEEGAGEAVEKVFDRDGTGLAELSNARLSIRIHVRLLGTATSHRERLDPEADIRLVILRPVLQRSGLTILKIVIIINVIVILMSNAMANRPTAGSRTSSDRSRQERPASSNPGSVPVRRNPIALARRFNQICTSVAAEAVSGTELTHYEYAVLVYLNSAYGEPDIDQINLAARIGIDRNHVSLLVARLEQKDFLERRINGSDRRARLLRLTAKGEKFFQRIRPIGLRGMRRVLAPLAPIERELFLDLLVRVVEGNRQLARPGAGRIKRGAGILKTRTL